MKNEIISELRRIRDARARQYNYNIEAMGCDLMRLDPWMEKKTFVMKGGRMVSIASVRRGKSRGQSARRSE